MLRRSVRPSTFHGSSTMSSLCELSSDSANIRATSLLRPLPLRQLFDQHTTALLLTSVRSSLYLSPDGV